MKKINLLQLLALLVIFFAVNSCSKEGSIGVGALTAKIHDQSYSSFIRQSNYSNATGILTIVSTDGTDINTGQKVAFYVNCGSQGIPDKNLPQTYTLTTNAATPLNQCGAYYAQMATQTGADLYTSTEGNVTFTTVDNPNRRVSGTFQFTVKKGTDYIIISEGSFTNLLYTME